MSSKVVSGENASREARDYCQVGPEETPTQLLTSLVILKYGFN